jgi:hypothetical protein
MRRLLKSSFDQNSIIINHKLNSDFISHLIFLGTQEELLALLITCKLNGDFKSHIIFEMTQE